VVAQLAGQLVTNPTAQVNIGDREDEAERVQFSWTVTCRKMAMRHGISPPA
jgi:hypothetical protein